MYTKFGEPRRKNKLHNSERGAAPLTFAYFFYPSLHYNFIAQRECI
jgi:hypothetical protein